MPVRMASYWTSSTQLSPTYVSFPSRVKRHIRNCIFRRLHHSTTLTVIAGLLISMQSKGGVRLTRSASFANPVIEAKTSGVILEDKVLHSLVTVSGSSSSLFHQT